jgi:hypothetical protein
MDKKKYNLNKCATYATTNLNLILARTMFLSSYHISDIFRDDYDELSRKRKEHSKVLFPNSEDDVELQESIPQFEPPTES